MSTVDHDARRARNVLRKNLSGPGSCGTCMNCGWSPGPGFARDQTCLNCAYQQYVDDALGGISETEALHIQVWALKHALLNSHREARSVITYLQTGKMEPPFRTVHAESGLARAMLSDADEAAGNMRLRETWKDYVW